MMTTCEHDYPTNACPHCLSRAAAFQRSLYLLSDEELRLARCGIEKCIKQLEKQQLEAKLKEVQGG